MLNLGLTTEFYEPLYRVGVTAESFGMAVPGKARWYLY